MGEFKATPGPWSAEKNMNGQLCIWGKGWRICIVNEDTKIRYKSNAQLISKAPELLEKLDELAEELEFHQVSIAKAKEARKLIKEATAV